MDKQNYNWVNVWERSKRSHCAFNFFIGARGTGKTYGALLHQHEDYTAGECGKYMYMRLLQAELDICASAEDNPYKKHNRRYGWEVHFEADTKSKLYKIIDDSLDEDNKILGSARSLGTFGNVRGSDFDDYTHIIFDEFAPAERVRRTPELKAAGYLFSQAYETINRNRELEGRDPVIVIFLANAFRLDSDLLSYYGITQVIETMQRTGQKRCTISERSIYIELCDAPDVSNAKRDTVLYKALAGNKKIEAVNLNNTFTDYNLTLVKRMPLNEFYPLVRYDDLTIYNHKSNGTMYLKVCYADCREAYAEAERGKFAKKWRAYLKSAMLERLIYTEDASALYRLQDALDTPL